VKFRQLDKCLIKKFQHVFNFFWKTEAKAPVGILVNNAWTCPGYVRVPMNFKFDNDEFVQEFAGR
jgi:hypothetical protein